MANKTVHLALFGEDQIDEAAEAIERLRKLGISDRQMSVISGVPLSQEILGRPMSWTRVPLIALAGAVVGLVTALLLTFGTQMLYPIRVGNMPNTPIPASIVVVFELTMLGLLLSTLLGVVVEMVSPSFGPSGYDPRITAGHIGLLFNSANDLDPEIHAQLTALGAELVHHTEEKKLWP